MFCPGWVLEGAIASHAWICANKITDADLSGPCRADQVGDGGEDMAHLLEAGPHTSLVWSAHGPFVVVVPPPSPAPIRLPFTLPPHNPALSWSGCSVGGQHTSMQQLP